MKLRVMAGLLLGGWAAAEFHSADAWAQAAVPPAPSGEPAPASSTGGPPSTGTPWTSSPSNIPEGASPTPTTGPGSPPPTAPVQATPAGLSQPAVQYVAVPIDSAPVYVTPEAPPRRERKVDPATIHRHDGFFLRLGIGGGYLWNTMKESNFEYKVRGTVIPLEVLIGGSILPGVVVGGGLWLSPGAQLHTEGSDATSLSGSDLQMTFFQLGPFVDYYLDPKQGFHLLFAATLAGFKLAPRNDLGGSLSSAQDFDTINASGFAATAGVGQEFWIGDQWSAGGMLRLTYANLDDTNAGVTTNHQIWSPALVATFTLN